MDNALHDLRRSVRVLAKSPGPTSIAILALALGSGANTAAFSMVHALLLSPLPYHQPERLVAITTVDFSSGEERGLSAADLDDLRSLTGAFESVAGMQQRSLVLQDGADPELVTATAVTPEVFGVLGMEPRLGHAWSSDDALSASAGVALIGPGFWHRRFGGDPAVVGRTLRLDGQAVTVVGILPSDPNFPARQVDLWVPLARPKDEGERTSRRVAGVGRMAAGIAATQAQAQVDRLASRLQRAAPSSDPVGLRVTRLDGALGAKVRTRLLLLQAAAGFVLLIACANVANLLLARAAGRTREVAIRAALGAERRHLLRQFLAESLVLALAGGAAGLLISRWLLNALIAAAPERLARAAAFHLDLPIFAFTLAVAVTTGIVFGIVPALRAAATNAADTLRKGGAASASSFGHDRFRAGLLVAEMAMSLVLLVASGLMTRAYWHLENVPPGFDPRNALAVDLAVPEAFYPDERQLDGYYRAVLERVQTLAGVEAAGMADVLPLVGWNPGTGFRAEGREDALRRADLQPISPDYFRAMGVPIVRGRTVSEAESRDQTPVAVVNARFAQMTWPDGEPLGKRLRLEEEPAKQPGPWLTIVGVAGDVRQFGIQEEPRPEIYIASVRRTMSLVVRTGEDPARLAESVVRAVRSVDPGLPAPAARTLEAAVADSLATRRLAAVCFGVLAGVASLLAALGLYGVMSYSVGKRTREIGIRLALGESTGSVTRLVLRQCALLTLAGAGLGLLGALATTPLLRSSLYGVSPLDPATFAGATLLLAVVALFACGAPLRAATRLDPVAALREE